MEGMAAQNPPDSKGASSKQAVALNGFYGILRTGGRIPAGWWQKRRDELVIEGKSPDNEFFNHTEESVPLSGCALENCLTAVIKLSSASRKVGWVGRCLRMAITSLGG